MSDIKETVNSADPDPPKSIDTNNSSSADVEEMSNSPSVNGPGSEESGENEEEQSLTKDDGAVSQDGAESEANDQEHGVEQSTSNETAPAESNDPCSTPNSQPESGESAAEIVDGEQQTNETGLFTGTFSNF